MNFLTDSAMRQPWDLTMECASHVAKLDSISSDCRLSAAEELQIFDSDLVVKDVTSLRYSERIHDEYSVSLCFNRQQQLFFHVTIGRQSGDESDETNHVACRTPSRVLASNWPNYHDGTVFGEVYMKMIEVMTVDVGDSSWTKLVGKVMG